jgi:hypothetical protein
MLATPFTRTLVNEVKLKPGKNFVWFTKFPGNTLSIDGFAVTFSSSFHFRDMMSEIQGQLIIQSKMIKISGNPKTEVKIERMKKIFENAEQMWDQNENDKKCLLSFIEIIDEISDEKLGKMKTEAKALFLKGELQSGRDMLRMIVMIWSLCLCFLVFKFLLNF